MAESATSATAAAPSTEAKEAPSTSGQAKPDKNKKNYRGKGSKGAHDDQFRRAAGAKAMAANDARLDQVLFSHLTSITTKLQNFNHTPQPVVSTIPQTTRGIGLAVQEAANFANARKPFIGITVHQMYRVALAQHALIRQRSPPAGHTYYPTAPMVRFDAPPFYGFDIKMSAHDRHFAPVVAVLSAFGNLSTGGNNYHGFLPRPGITISVATTSGKKSKGGTATTVYSALNPFTVCFENLRQVCEELSDENIPVELRNYFIEHNPIPGAHFAGGLLLNPDEIMPPNYNITQLGNDCAALKVSEDVLAKNYAHAFATINYSGKATLASFVNCEYKARLQGSQLIEDQPINTVSVQNISATQYCLGSLALVGERCPRQNDYFTVYGSRRMQSGVQTMETDWTELARSLLNR